MREDENASREQLLHELSKLRDRVSELEGLEIAHKRQEGRLRESEERFQTLFRHHHAVMLLIEPDSGKIVDANDGASRFYGYTRDQLLSMNISVINRSDPSEIARKSQSAKKGERNYFVFPHRLAGGEVKTVEVHSTPIDVQGQTLLFSIIHDITDRKKAEEELRGYQERLEALVKERTAELERKNELLTLEIAERKQAEIALQISEGKQGQLAYELETIIDSFPGPIFYKDAENNFLRVNRYLEEMHHLAKDQLEGKSLFDLYPADLAQAYWDDDMEVIRSGKSKLNIEEAWSTPEGPKWVLTFKIPFLDKTGKIVGVIGISQNITKRKKAEEDREKLIVEIREALSKIKTLSGLLPICSSCKKIRNDRGYWEHIEIYIRDHSEADFTHGICPECAEKLYPEYHKKK